MLSLQCDSCYDRLYPELWAKGTLSPLDLFYWGIITAERNAFSCEPLLLGYYHSRKPGQSPSPRWLPPENPQQELQVVTLFEEARCKVRSNSPTLGSPLWPQLSLCDVSSSFRGECLCSVMLSVKRNRQNQAPRTQVSQPRVMLSGNMK